MSRTPEQAAAHAEVAAIDKRIAEIEPELRTLQLRRDRLVWSLMGSSGSKRTTPHAIPFRSSAPPAINPIEAELVVDHMRVCQRRDVSRNVLQIARDLGLEAQTVRLIAAADSRFTFRPNGVVMFREAKGGAA